MRDIIEPIEEDSKREPAPGFFETRRRMFWVPAFIAASVILDRRDVLAAEFGQKN